MKKLKQSSISKFLSSLVIVALLSIMVAPQPAMAASVTSASAAFGRLAVSTNSEYGTLQFNTPTGIQAGTSDDIILTFSSEFVLAAEVAANFDIELGDNVCASASFTDQVVDTAAADADNWSIDVTGDVITIEPETDVGLTAGRCFRLVWGTAATTGGTGAADTIVNSTDVDDDDTITISGGFGDSGTITVDIIDGDQVTISATVNQSITFDLDTTAADTCGVTESAAAYSVALGTVSVTDTRVSGATDTVNHICVDLDTNASGGAAVTVRNANGANGLVSTSVPADDIDSTDGAVADGTENYGLCIVTATASSGTLDDEGDYDSDTCAANSETNDVAALSAAGETIFDTNGAPIAGGRGQIAVNASVTGVQQAHADYADTLTFVATGTF